MSRNFTHWLIFIVFLIGISILIWGYNSDLKTEEKILAVAQKKSDHNSIAVIKTNLGVLELELFDKIAPKTVNNFIKLSKQGFYDGVKFHRVIKDFMIQSGDPNSKDDDWSDDGFGGPGYVFEDEINEYKLVRGVIAMANGGPNTNGSQFFIITALATPWLDGKHTVFGKVINGMEIVDKIENLDVNQNAHPLQDATIQSIKIIK